MSNNALPFPVPVPPPNRGRMLSAKQVAADVFNGTVSESWVRRNLPGKIRLGHSTVVWWELDVRHWLEARSVAHSSCPPDAKGTNCDITSTGTA